MTENNLSTSTDKLSNYVKSLCLGSSVSKLTGYKIQAFYD